MYGLLNSSSLKLNLKLLFIWRERDFKIILLVGDRLLLPRSIEEALVK